MAVSKKLEHLIQKVKFFRPSHEEVCCSMGGLLTLSAFYLVQDLVSLIDSWAKLVLSSKARRILEIAKLDEQRARECALAAEGTDKPRIASGYSNGRTSGGRPRVKGLMPQRMGSRAA